VCVIDREGRIIAFNDAWKHASSSHSGSPLPLRLGGIRSDREAGSHSSYADATGREMQQGIRAVLEGAQDEFSMEYRAVAAGVDRWYLLTVERLRVPAGGAVLSHQNITSRKRAEFEAEQRRQELAHVSRVSTMGELAAAIAHELNQPLTGVLTNAQAAMRYLSHDPPNLDEVTDILRDIIEDDRRAGEVIRRLRSMLQTGAIEPAEVDVNEIVADVLRLVGSDAVLRSVTLEPELAAGPQRVHGDRIQLQQVVLNLIVNAMDAMKGTPASDRHVTVRTMAPDRDTILVAVVDCGPGIDRDKLGRIFQPFFTTKQDGLGMGLSIARSIVEAHGGMLWAVNNPDVGASFLCRLPAYAASGDEESLIATA
jgi:signal transduction histidine kinase